MDHGLLNRGLWGVMALVLLPLVGGCQTQEPPPARFADIRFANEAQIRLAVDQIDVVHQFEPSFKPPQVEHMFPVTPERALENFVRDRFVAVGQQTGHRLRYTIIDASVREVVLPRKQGVAAAFTVEVSERYDGHAAVKVEVLNARGFPEGSIVAEATSSRSVTEDATFNAREKVWDEIARELSRQIGATIESRARDAFGRVVQP